MKNINRYNINKWLRMFSGKSILHVNQGVGKIYSKNEIVGYYNDLTEKVLKGENLHTVEIPTVITETGQEIEFPIAVFQYGLGSYDLYILENKEIYLKKFKLMSDWALENQEENGAWNNFFFIYPQSPYSAMAQGEGVSLLIRAYIKFGDEKYLAGAKKAVDFLVTPLEYGGTTKYIDEEVYMQEFTNKHTVLNGWVFALFGVYDFLKVVDDKNINKIYNRSIKTMVAHLKDFDNGYWSEYNLNHMITSPFYHNLHIAQLRVMFDITSEPIFNEFAAKWEKYQRNNFNKIRALVLKVAQKISE